MTLIRCSIKVLIALLMTGCMLAKPMKTVRLDLPKDADRFSLLNPGSWQPDTVDGLECLVLAVPGPQLPPVRRPGEYALLKQDEPFRDYTVTVTGQSLEPETLVGRDICILFGYHDASRFYYAHISNDSNGETHNVIMKVEGDTRRRISREDRPVARMTAGWHMIRVEHRASGKITVWVDDMDRPVMTARDTAYPSGGVGFGAFDDRAAFSVMEVVVD